MSLEGKVALVTGASRGIGKAIATQLGKQGATVIGTATSDNGAEAISGYLAEQGFTGTGIKLDVGSQESVDQVVASIKEQFGDVQVLVNNAGITKDNLMLRMKADEWDQVINTNLNSVFRTAKACLKGMTKSRWGRIITISAVVGSMGNTGQSNYAATKAGVEGFSRSLARELASRSITVNSVAPGFIETDMTHELPEAHKETLLKQVPAGRLGSADEIANAVVFLASDQAAYITGETLHVNGGMYMG